MKTRSTIRPADFEITEIGTAKEILKAENINEIVDEQGTCYEYDLYLSTSTAKDYSDLVKDIIHARYPYDEELKLINIGIADSASPPYVAYREYVAFAKMEAAKRYAGE